MSIINIEIDEKKLRNIVFEYLTNTMEGLPINKEDISIEVKSKQNYKSEWENAAFRAYVKKPF